MLQPKLITLRCQIDSFVVCLHQYIFLDPVISLIQLLILLSIYDQCITMALKLLELLLCN
jgi:hypothetical protein